MFPQIIIIYLVGKEGRLVKEETWRRAAEWQDRREKQDEEVSIEDILNN